MKNWYGLSNLLNIKTEIKEEVPKDEKELKKFINDKIKESNFSTNLSDAFLRNNPTYKMVEDNDQRLIDKYCNKEYPNPKYNEKKEKYEGVWDDEAEEKEISLSNINQLRSNKSNNSKTRFAICFFITILLYLHQFHRSRTEPSLRIR